MKDLSKQRIFLLVSFVILALGFSCNFWHVSPEDKFRHFDDYSESLSLGRIHRASHDGLFSHGALPGVNYESNKYPENSDYLFEAYSLQEGYYVNDSIPDSYFLYMTQTGGHLTFFSIVHKILPFDNRVNFHIIHTVNAILSALCFVLILGWAYRNFGLIASSVMLLLITLSPWLTYYGYSLWWGLWCIYVPFVATLLVLERNHKKKMKPGIIIFYIALSVFIKCMLNGFEVITTSLVALVCPIVYYFFLEKRRFMDFVFFSAKVTLFSALAAVLEMLLLITQIRAVKGSFAAGVNHIISSYQKRTAITDDSAYVYFASPFNLLRKYFKGNAFEWGFLSEGAKPFWFIGLFAVMGLAGTLVYWLGKKLSEPLRRRNLALLLTFTFSILAPLSWLIIFRQHSANHFHLDYIVWYVPFALFGFLIIGECISLLLYRMGIGTKSYRND